MLKRHQPVLGVAAAITVALAAGCGMDRHTTVLTHAFVLPGDPARYPDGSPAKAAMQLLLAIEYNDPAAAASFFVPAWRLTSSKLAEEIRGPLSGCVAIAGRSPRLLSHTVGSRRATLVVVIPGFKQLILEFERVGSRWELGGLRVGAVALTPPGTTQQRTKVITARHGRDATPAASICTTLVSTRPTISRVVFRRGPTNPEIVIDGRDFGSRPEAEPRSGIPNPSHCAPISGNTGDDFGSKLWLENRTQAWSAGYTPYTDCIGLIVSKYTDREIVYRLGSFYNQHYGQPNHYAGVYKLAVGDTVDITVNGAVIATPVHYSGS